MGATDLLSAPSTVDILPTSGTTDPAILASIPPLVQTASVEAAAAPQATAIPLAVDEIAAIDDPDQVLTPGVGMPRLITRRQQIQATAAWKKAEKAAAAADGQVTVQSVSGMLAQHNIYRARHGAPAMVWDNTLAANAQAWANGCRWQ